MNISAGIEVAMAVIMAGGLIGVFIDRCKQEKGIGLRIIQFLALVLVIPAIVILSLEEKLSNETTGALLGTVLGFVLSGIGKDELRKRKPPTKPAQPGPAAP